MVKRAAIFLMTIVVLLSFAEVSFAAATDSHTVTVQVQVINELGISGGNVTLTINTATAGSNPTDAQDNTTSDLLWTSNESSKKVTVATDLAAPNFTLKTLAQNVTGGTAAAEITLSTTVSDFVTGIGSTTGNCDLQYTASTTAASGTGTDSHTITYTLTDS